MTLLSGHADFMEPESAPGPLLASGRTSDIYILDEDRLLRRNRYRDVGANELELLRYVSAHGFPAPTPYEVHGRDLILERLHGPTLLQSLAAGETSLYEAATILADLHAQLHALRPPADVAPGEVIIHSDLHPANVVLTEGRGPCLIDWTNSALGHADVDVAMTAIMIGEVAVDSGGDYSRAAQGLLAAFLGRVRPDPLPGLDAAIARRLADSFLEPGERSLVPESARLVRHLRGK